MQYKRKLPNAAFCRFFYPDLKQLRYKASGFGKALKAGPSPAEGTGWLEGHQAVPRWECWQGSAPQALGTLCQGVVHWHKSPSSPCWPGLDALSLAHGGVFQHTQPSALAWSLRIGSSTLPHTLQHPSTRPKHVPVPASQTFPLSSGLGRITCLC